MKINLIVQYYVGKSPARQAEVDFCLAANLQNRFIDQLHLLTEKTFDFTGFPCQEKIVQTVIGDRLTFDHVFRHANSFNRSDVWIVSNADIYFDETLQYLYDARLDKFVYALTRHDVQPDGKIVPVHEDFAHGCQDAWVFRTPVVSEQMFTNFNLGVSGCDGRIAYEFVKAGYKVINPSLKIVAYHLDLTRESDIHERNAEYFKVMTEEGYESGSAAPPPYQYYIFPVDQIDPDSFDMFKRYIDNLTSLGRRPAEMSRQLGRQFEELHELRHTIEMQKMLLAKQADELQRFENLYVQLLNSISWKITSPVRKLLDMIKK